MKKDNKLDHIVKESTLLRIPSIGNFHYISDKNIEDLMTKYAGSEIDVKSIFPDLRILGAYSFQKPGVNVTVLEYFPFLAFLLYEDNIQHFDRIKDKIIFNFISEPLISVFFYIHLLGNESENIFKNSEFLHLEKRERFNVDIFKIGDRLIYEKVTSRQEGFLFPNKEMYDTYYLWMKNIASGFEDSN